MTVMDSVSSTAVRDNCVSSSNTVKTSQTAQTQSQSSTQTDHTSNRDTFEYTLQDHTPVGVMYEGSGQVFPVSMGGTTGSNTVNQYTSKITNSYLSDGEYEKLAADLAGIETDIDGNHSCTYEETLKYGEIIAKLHKYGIKRSTSIEEAAAAAAGLEYKYGSPQITNADEGKNYSTLLSNLRKANETVASEAGVKVNEMVV